MSSDFNLTAGAVYMQEGLAVILAGDLNNPPDSLHMHFMQRLLPDLRDAWVAANPQDKGPTANHPESSFSKSSSLDCPQYIDHIMFAQARDYGCSLFLFICCTVPWEVLASSRPRQYQPPPALSAWVAFFAQSLPLGKHGPSICNASHLHISASCVKL